MKIIIPILAFLALASCNLPVETVKFQNIISDYSVKVDVDFLLHIAKKQNLAVEMEVESNSLIMFRISMCMGTVLESKLPVKHQKFYFQDDWIPYFLNDARSTCSDNRIQLDIFPSKPSTGTLKFQVVDHQENLSDYGIYPIFPIVRDAGQYVSFKTKIDNQITQALINPNMTLQLVSDMEGAVKINFGKCGLFIDEFLILMNDDKLELSRKELISIRRVSMLRCLSENVAHVFDFHVTAFTDAVGAIMIEQRSASLKSKESSSWGIVIFIIGIVSVIASIAVAVFFLCKKRYVEIYYLDI